MEYFQSFFAQASSQRLRSTALYPLGWLIFFEFCGLTTMSLGHADEWLLRLISVLLSLTVLCYLVAYGIFMFRSPDALRSERFVLSRMQIERTPIGDNITGLRNADEVLDADTIPTQLLESRMEATDE